LSLAGDPSASLFGEVVVAVAERKADTSSLGPMPMTATVRLSLIALRGYLVLMCCLCFIT
jgi:hypothetical protein